MRFLQIKMTGRIAHWYPVAEEPWPDYARHCAARSRVQWQQAGIPEWDQAICAAWCFAGHAAHLSERCPERLIGNILGRRDAWWRPTLRHVHGGAQNRLGRGHRKLGRRRWDELVQQAVNSEAEQP